MFDAEAIAARIARKGWKPTPDEDDAFAAGERQSAVRRAWRDWAFSRRPLCARFPPRPCEKAMFKGLCGSGP
jgi:hypothetical protein